MTLAVVLLNWKNSPDTIECIHSIVSAQHQESCYLVVCDNNSSDSSAVLIRDDLIRQCVKVDEWRWCSGKGEFYCDRQSISSQNIHSDVIGAFIQIDQNLGFAGGNNVGLKWVLAHTDAECILILNNDTVVESTALSAGAHYLRTHPKQAFAGCVVRYFHNPDYVQAYGGASFSPVFGRAKHLYANDHFDGLPPPGQVLNEISYPLGAAMFVSRNFLDDVGLMYEKYFLYFEEIDWAYQAKAKGYEVGVVSTATIFHKEGGTIGSSHDKKKRSHLSEHFLNRARVMFTRRWCPVFLPSTLIYSLFLVFRALLKGDAARAAVVARATWSGLTVALK